MIDLLNAFEVAEDSPTGLRWKLPSNRKVKAGSVAGFKLGVRWRVRYNGADFLCHRVVALLEGILSLDDFKDPTVLVDHRNGNALDNRPSNLRKTTHRGNMQNLHKHREGKLLGCYLPKGRNKWVALIVIDGKQKYLGSFDTEQEAHAAHMESLNEL
ncbi:HNH nuclease [Vibrio phage 1.208.B._10N.222.52.A7]|nr:HNH nuclease [Vibrio phage 1.208.B._10N.222.52.A7]